MPHRLISHYLSMVLFRLITLSQNMSKRDCYSGTRVFRFAHVGTLLEICTYSLLLDYLHENLVNVHARSATCIRVA